MTSFRDVLALIKLRQTLLLLLALVAGYALGAKIHNAVVHIPELAAACIVGFASIASTTALNMYFDVDIDAVMSRTAHRPLPAGRLNPRHVLYASAVCISACILISLLLLNIYYTLWLIVGFTSDILAYTILLKRRTWTSIFAGSVAGAAPFLGGYSIASGVLLDYTALLGAVAIIVWIPAHIWLLTIHYIDDYVRAGVPMLPVVLGWKAGVYASAASITAFTAIAIVACLAGHAHPALALAAIAGSMAALLSLRWCKPRACKLQFRLVNLSLALLLAAIIIA